MLVASFLRSVLCGVTALFFLVSTAAAAATDGVVTSSTPLCTSDVECFRMAAGLTPVPTSFLSNLTAPHRMTPLATTPTLSAAGDGLNFRLVSDGNAWDGRAMLQLHILTKPISFKATSGTMKFPGPTMVVFGGWIPGGGAQNDVWASSDMGKVWYLISGHTRLNVEAIIADTSFTDTYNAGAASVMDPSNENIFRLGGLPNTPMSTEVWMTTNAVTWKPQIGREPMHSSGFYPAVVFNSKGHMIEATGDDRAQYGNDVWLSTDQGKNWKEQTDAAPYSARYAQMSMNWQSPTADIMWVIGGQSSYDSLNDVWASSDEGRTWAAINPSGPFPQRRLGGSAITKDGLLILAGGFADTVPGVAPTNLASVANDVWVSADGGYSWGRCIEDAQWDDRYLPAVAVGPDGVLYVGSGVQFDGGRGFVNIFQDMWKSTISFHDLPAISKACGITIPSCGTGLRCWPGKDTVKATDGSYVSCAACPYEGLGGGGGAASGAVIGVMVVFIVLSVLLMGVVGYLWTRMQKGGGKEAPLFMKGTGDSDSDGLYHQHGGEKSIA